MDDDEIEAELARLDGPGVSREECFPLGRMLHTQRRKDSLKSAARRAARQFIEPANADEVVAAFPEQPAISLLASVYFWETNQAIARAAICRRGQLVPSL